MSQQMPERPAFTSPYAKNARDGVAAATPSYDPSAYRPGALDMLKGPAAHDPKYGRFSTNSVWVYIGSVFILVAALAFAAYLWDPYERLRSVYAVIVVGALATLNVGIVAGLRDRKTLADKRVYVPRLLLIIPPLYLLVRAAKGGKFAPVIGWVVVTVLAIGALGGIGLYAKGKFHNLVQYPDRSGVAGWGQPSVTPTVDLASRYTCDDLAHEFNHTILLAKTLDLMNIGIKAAGPMTVKYDYRTQGLAKPTLGRGLNLLECDGTAANPEWVANDVPLPRLNLSLEEDPLGHLWMIYQAWDLDGHPHVGAMDSTINPGQQVQQPILPTLPKPSPTPGAAASPSR